MAKWSGALKLSVPIPTGRLGLRRQPRSNTGSEEGSQKRKPGSGMLGRCQESHKRAREFPHLQMGKPVRSTDPPSPPRPLPNTWESDTTDWASSASKHRPKGKAESLTPALGPSPLPLSPVPGCRFRAQIVGGVLKLTPLRAQLSGISSSRSSFTMDRNPWLDYNSRHAAGGTDTTRSSAGWLGGNESR